MAIPLVTVKQSLTAHWDTKTEPGFHMEINATYRDLPDEVLIQLEKTLAGGVQKMAEYAEAALASTK